MSDEARQLPDGWVWTTLEEVCDVVMGQSPPSSSYNEDGIGLPFFQGKAEFTELYPEIRKWCSSPGKVAEPDDVLLSVRAPVGPTNLAQERCAIGRGLAAIRAYPTIPAKYVLYALRAFQSKLADLATGTTFEAVSGGIVRELCIPLAPLAEQRRIVAAIEQQFTRLDAGVAALKRAQAALKCYRAAVLKAAVEGSLTADWRAEHLAAEPADALLARILAERRARWEADLRAKGKDPAKATYTEPKAPDTASLPTLPIGWCWATVEQLVSRSEYGTSVKCSYEATGVPVLRIPNIAAGQIDLTDMKYATVPLGIGENDALQIGDLLMCRTNGSVSLIGKVAVVNSELKPYHTFASYLLRFRLIEWRTLPAWLHVFMTSWQGRRFIETNAASSAGQHNISLTLIHSMPIALPPLAEQEQIVDEVERRLSVVAELETTIAANLKRAERLRQSILREAFAGRLVPQDASDEPASVLLARIQAERAARAASNGTGRNGRNGRNGHTRRNGSVEETAAVAAEETVEAGGGAQQQVLWREE